MTWLSKLEDLFGDVFNKKGLVKIPESVRESLANAMWWLAIVFGLVELWKVWNYWSIGHPTDSIYGLEPIAYDLGFFFFLTLFAAALGGVLMLLASPGLKAMHKPGWRLFFYGLLFNIFYGVFRVFSEYGSVWHLLSALVGSLVGLYILFQVRDHFKVKSSKVRKV